MKIGKWLLIVVAVVVVLGAGYLTYLGYFSSPKPYETKTGPYVIAYESFVGPYSKTGPVFASVYDALEAVGVKGRLGIGIYYDDPARVPADKLRSDCGMVLEKGDLAKLKGKFNIKVLPKTDSVIVEFPIRNTLSYAIGPMKAYPILMRYAREKNYKTAGAYELYDEINRKIYFVMAIQAK